MLVRARTVARRPLRITRLALLVTLAACGSPPVDWTETTSLDGASGGALALDDAGHATLATAADPTPASLPAGPRCEGSLRVVRQGAPASPATMDHAAMGHAMPTASAADARGALVAVWWAPRSDSSAALLAARSTDGGASWSAPVPVDTLDRGRTGCRRAAPSVAAGEASGYVHVAYGLVAPEGAGVFFAHTMPGHFLFHTPVAIAYGERPARATVAASGTEADGWVVVAYEDPSAEVPHVGLSISRTQGHTFEARDDITPAAGAATDPQVALRGSRIAVAWTERTASEGDPTPRGDGVRRVRVGVLRK